MATIEVGCEKETFALMLRDEVPYEENNGVVSLVNQTISNVYSFILQSQKQGKVVAVDFGRGESICQMVFDDGSSTDVSLKSPQSEVGFPDITVGEDIKGYYWIINYTQRGKVVERTIRMSGALSLKVKYESGFWWYSIGTKHWEIVNTVEIPKMQIVLFSDMEYVSSVLFSTGCRVDVKWNKKIIFIRSDTPNESFYKDVFLDAGYALANRTYIPAAAFLGLKIEYFSTSQAADTILQNQIIGGNLEDSNGRLLFPDGQPRYKLLFVVGGDARSHGKSLRSQTRDKMRDFYYSGGGYVGTCAGAALASNGFNTTDNYPYYLHLWPYSHLSSRVHNSSVGMKMFQGSPLLNYYNYGGDSLVSNVRHNGGLYVDRWPAGAEILAWNDSTSDSLLRGKPAIWSYKKDKKSGRMVVTGSHPESYTSGERRDLMAAMLQYAIEGRGISPIKGVLKNGEVREMNKSTEDNDPNYTKIGDLQYHHFVVYIPQGAVNVVFQVSSPIECDMQLMLSNKMVPYIGNANYVTSMPGANQSLQFPTLEQGLWYVSVKCNTTVTATTEEWGHSYSGRTDVLNGVPYSVSVAWDRLNRNK